jgi:hypothetical protein
MKYTVYIPTKRITTEVTGDLDTLRWIAGGRTDSEATGHWLDAPTMVTEPITRFEFIVGDASTPGIHTFETQLRVLTRTLHELGESSVLIEVTQPEIRFV